MCKRMHKISRATKPPLRRIIEEIQSLRRERGKKARGDFLLRKAQAAFRATDVASARTYLEMFMTTSPNTPTEHRIVLNVVLSKLKNTPKFKLSDKLITFLNMIMEILKLVGRNLLSCIFRGILIPDYIYDK